MKRVIIDNKHEGIISETLDSVQARAKTRTITTKQIFDTCEYIEKKLGIPKKSMAGCEFIVDLNAQNYPNAYKFTPESTKFRLLYDKKWYLLWIDRMPQVKNGYGKEIDSRLTEEAKRAIIEKYETF